MKKFTPSATTMMASKADLLRKQGAHVFNFSTGDPILVNHSIVLSAAKTALEDGLSPYAPVAGLIELRQLAAAWMNHRYGTSFDTNQTIVTCGGKFAIYAALQTLLEPGDEVLIPTPHWVSYPEMVRLSLGSPRLIFTSDASGWKISPQMLKAQITSKSKILIFNNACNPTGVLYSREEIREILRFAEEANLLVISDEVYSEIVFDGAEFISCSSFPEHSSRVVVVESCSKNFGMAGWRVGFAFGPKEIISNMIALQSQTTSGTSLFSQKIAIQVMRAPEKIASYVREKMDSRRKLFFDTFNRIFSQSIQPAPSALYFFTKIGDNSVQVCEKLLSEGLIALVPGVAFGMEGFARFAFTETEDDIVKGLKALGKLWHPSKAFK